MLLSAVLLLLALRDEDDEVEVEGARGGRDEAFEEATDISLLLIIGGLLFKLFPASVEDELLLCVGK